ncbi:unnamed protein product [Caenorhabditis nigoni]
MSYAYDLLPEQEKNGITDITLNDAWSIQVILRGNSIDGSYCRIIRYSPEGNDTSVTMNFFTDKAGQNHEEDHIFHNDRMSVLLADLKMLLKNQKTVLHRFFIEFLREYQFARVWKCIEETLKGRTSSLAVHCFRFTNSALESMADSTSAWSIVRCLNSAELWSVFFDFPSSCQRRYAPGSRVRFEDHLDGLRGLGKGFRFKLNISIKTMRKEYLTAINEFPSFSESLFDFQLNFEDLQHQEDCNTVLSDKFFVEKESFNKWNIIFCDTNPRVQEPPVDTIEEIGRSVLENALLMQSVLEHLEYFDIQRLRKVNKGVRKCIDEVKPDPHIKKFLITFDLRPSALQTESSVLLKYGEFKNISYKAQTSRCLNDFETTLKHQKSCMEELSIVFQFTIFERLDSCIEFCTGIEEILKRREQPLKTQKLSITYGSQKDSVKIIAAIDKDSLKTLQFSDPSDPECKAFFGDKFLFEVGLLSQTDQWNNAEQLIVKDLTVPTPIQDINILHFSSLEILMKTLSSQDVNYLKTNLLKSSSFQKFKIFFRESSLDEQLHELIGEPFRIVSESKKIWYFRMENVNFYIHIALDTHDVKDIYGKLKPKVIIFTRVAKEDTPFFDLGMEELALD